jgi:perosamine synthetase
VGTLAEQNLKKISWWKIALDDTCSLGAYETIQSKNLSMGSTTKTLEQELEKLLGVEHVICTCNGSSALLLSLLALELKSGDEVIIPNRTWIASAHAAKLIGCKVKLVDVMKDRPVMDVSRLEEALSENTKVVMPAQICGCAVDLDKIQDLQTSFSFEIIEDSAQALFGKFQNEYIGTRSTAGCFSFAVSKLLTSGQGGFVVTNNSKLAEKMVTLRTHGVSDVNQASPFDGLGFNFRFTDIQAAIILKQLPDLHGRIEKLKSVYLQYKLGIQFNKFFNLIPVNIDQGEIPLYVEVMTPFRKKLEQFLNSHNVETRKIYPNLETAKYLNCIDNFPNSIKFQNEGLVLPCGPDQTPDDICSVIDLVNQFIDENNLAEKYA